MRRRSGNDLLAIYLGLEWSSLCFYVLAAIRRGSAYSTEAGLKYFVIGAVSSGIYLFGASLLYGATGSIQLGELNRRRLSFDEMSWSLASMSRMGASMVRIAFMFKLAIAPFHAWSPDVYEGSPTGSSLYFAVVPKRAMVIVILRLVYGAFGEGFQSRQAFLRRGSLSSRFVAARAARGQRRWKRFRAYSAIGHMGYLLLGISTGSLEGVQSSRIYALIYIPMSIAAWVGIMSVGHWLSSTSLVSGETSKEWTSAKYRTDFQGLHRRNAFLARSLSLSLRSMAGIPPRAGFVPKLMVFRSAMSQNLVIFSLFAVLISCVGAYYYLRWVKRIYFDGVNKETTTSQEYGRGSQDGSQTGTFSLSSSRSPSSPLVLDEGSGIILSLCLRVMSIMRILPGPLMLRSHRMALAFILSC